MIRLRGMFEPIRAEARRAAAPACPAEVPRSGTEAEAKLSEIFFEIGSNVSVTEYFFRCFGEADWMTLRGWGRAEGREGLPVVDDELTLRGKRTKRTHTYCSKLAIWKDSYEIYTVL